MNKFLQVELIRLGEQPKEDVAQDLEVHRIRQRRAQTERPGVMVTPTAP